MNSKKLVIIALSVGLLASFLASRYMADLSGASSSAAKLSPVVLVEGSVAAGTAIADSNVKLTNWPASSVPEGAYADVNKVVGRIAKQELVNGQPVLDTMLAPIDSKGGLASMIPLGKRAITVHVNEVMSVAGFALPGSYVDVLASIKDPKGEAFTKTVLRHVKILAVAQETESDPSKPKVVNAVTLELTAKESELLDVARSVGTLSLSLRNQYDDQELGSAGTSYDELFGKTLSLIHI